MKKYPFYYGEDKTGKTCHEAIKELESFVQICRDKNIKEYSFHLFLEHNYWRFYADSMKNTSTGKWIKEIIL